MSQCLVDMFHINIIPTFCFDQFSFFFYSRMQFLRFSAGFYLFILETIVELLFLKWLSFCLFRPFYLSVLVLEFVCCCPSSHCLPSDFVGLPLKLKCFFFLLCLIFFFFNLFKLAVTFGWFCSQFAFNNIL